MQEAGNSVWRGSWAAIGLTAVIASIVSGLIWHYGEKVGLNSPGEKYLCMMVAMFIVLAIRHGRLISMAIRERWHRLQAQGKNELPSSELRTEQTPPHPITVAELKHALRGYYGRFWRRNVSVLMLVGNYEFLSERKS